MAVMQPLSCLDKRRVRGRVLELVKHFLEEADAESA